MKAAELLEIIHERGLDVALIDGVPRVRGPIGLITPALLRCFNRRRADFAAMLSPVVELLGPNGGTGND